MQTGAAFAAFALTVVVASNVAQAIVGRIGVRGTLTAGVAASALSVAFLTRLPVHGHYFWDLFPGFVLGGAGLGLAFVPITIAEPRRRRARRRRRCVGPHQHEPPDRRGDRTRRGERDRRELVVLVSPRASHAAVASAGAGLDHGLQTGLYALTGLLIAGVLVAASLVRPAPAAERAAEVEDLVVLQDAA